MLRRDLADRARGRRDAARSGDVQLGTIAGAPFYIDAEQYERWGSPLFMLDVADGEAQGFSLSARDRHLVTRTAPVKAHANADGAG